MLVVNHGPTFDLKYLRIFRILQSMKQAIAPAVSSFLNSCSHLSEFQMSSPYTPGRCVPALSFLFHMPVIHPFLESDHANHNRHSTQALIEKMRYALEAQVRYIIRRSRVLPASARSAQLFALDPQRLVHLTRAPAEDPFEHFDPLAGFLSSDGSSSSSSQLDFPWLHQNAYFQDTLKLREFLLTQAQTIKSQAAAKGFELPLSKHFYLGCLTFQQFFLNRRNSITHGGAIEKLKNFLDPEYKFSQSRCIQALPAAKETYLRDLPQCYPSSVHEKQLEKALRYFYQNARGPAMETFVSRLREECTRVWKSGRRLCDALSLTGRSCTYRIHMVPNSGSAPLEPSTTSDTGPKQSDRPLLSEEAHYHKQKKYISVSSTPLAKNDSTRWQVKRRNLRRDGQEPRSLDMLIPGRVESGSKHGEDGRTYEYEEEDDTEEDVEIYDLSSSEEEGGEEARQEEGEKPKDTPRCMPHSSAHHSLHACNCGRSRKIREDPFELKEANHDFFQMECCRESLSFAFPPCSPVGEPMDPPLSHHPTSWSLCRVGPALLYRRDAGLTFEGFLPGYNHLSVLNVPCHYYPISSNSRRPLPATSSSTAPQAAFAASPALLHRPPNSAAGFNTLMSALSDELSAIHSALGTKPEIGAEGSLEMGLLYCRQKFLESKCHALHVAASHLGLPLPSSTHTNPSRSSSPPCSPIRRRDRQRRKERDSRDREVHNSDYNRDRSEADASLPSPSNTHKMERPQATFVNVLLGFEYECAAGHRFLAFPSKAHKHDVSCRMKNKGEQRVRLNSDVPLFSLCASAGCSQPFPAQLQRLYLVTPDQPESILLRPQVQWALSATSQSSNSSSTLAKKYLFELGMEIALPRNSLLCLRLPYVYTRDEREQPQQPLIQTSPSEPFQCCLLHNFLYVALPQVKLN